MKFISRLLKHESAANIIWQFFEKFITLGLTFIVSIYLIRYLGPKQYGILSYSTSYVLLFAALTTVGLQTIVIREITLGKIDPALVMGSSFAVMLCGSILAAILTISGALLARDPSDLLIVIGFGCFTNIITSFSVVNYYLMANFQSRYTSYVIIGQKTLDSVLTLILIHFKCSLIAIASLLLFESIFVYFVLYLIYSKKSKIKAWKYSFDTARFLLRESIPLAISGAVINLYMRLDQVMIEHFRGLSAVGIYSVGIKLSELLYILPGVLSINIFPLMVRKYNNSSHDFNLFMIKLYRWLFYFSILLASGFFISAIPLVKLLYGREYELSGIIFKYGVLSIIASFIGVINHLWLQIKGRQHYAIYITLCGLGCCFLLNLIFIPVYGIQGAVFVMVLTQTTASVFAFLLFDKTRECFKLFIYGVLFKTPVYDLSQANE